MDSPLIGQIRYLIDGITNSLVVLSFHPHFPSLFLHQTDDDGAIAIVVIFIRVYDGHSELWVRPEGPCQEQTSHVGLRNIRETKVQHSNQKLCTFSPPPGKLHMQPTVTASAMCLGAELHSFTPYGLYHWQ